MPRALIPVVYALLSAIVLAPLWSVQVPGLGDTLNHLARMHVLANIGTSPALQHFYEIRWAPIPYLAMDAIVPVLARILPIYLAGKIFLSACLLSPVAGAASLHYAVHRRISLVPAAAFLLSYNYLLAAGFLNYLFSAGLAVMLFAGWVATAGCPRWWRAAVFTPLLLLLYFGHAFACAGYCIAVAGFEIGCAVRRRFSPWRRVAADFCVAAVQALPAMYFAATLDVGSGYVGALQTHYGNVGAKLTALLSPAMFLVDRHTALILLAAFGLAFVMSRWASLSPRIWPAAAAVGLAAALMPNMLFSTWGLDLRFPIFTAMLVIGGASLRARPAFVTYTACACLSLLVAAKSVFAFAALQVLDSQVLQTRKILADMPIGARLLVVNVAGIRPQQAPLPPNTIWNMPMVAVIDRDAFVPYFFNGLTTVRMRDSVYHSSTPNGFPVTPTQLRQSIAAADQGPGRESDGEGGGGSVYWLGWPQKFDYVLVQRFGRDPGHLPENLVPVAHTADLDLYSVKR